MPTYEELKAQADVRWRELTNGDRPWIRVGTAMCGHATGAFDVRDAIKSELERQGIVANVDDVGCLGICYAEPLVDIQKPGGSRIFFNNVTPDDVPNILNSVLVENKLPSSKRARLSWRCASGGSGGSQRSAGHRDAAKELRFGMPAIPRPMM